MPLPIACTPPACRPAVCPCLTLSAYRLRRPVVGLAAPQGECVVLANVIEVLQLKPANAAALLQFPPGAIGNASIFQSHRPAGSVSIGAGTAFLTCSCPWR